MSGFDQLDMPGPVYAGRHEEDRDDERKRDQSG